MNPSITCKRKGECSTLDQSWCLICANSANLSITIQIYYESLVNNYWKYCYEIVVIKMFWVGLNDSEYICVNLWYFFRFSFIKSPWSTFQGADERNWIKSAGRRKFCPCNTIICQYPILKMKYENLLELNPSALFFNS